ncbi:MAG: phosphodiester glycosidase family protein, partial [Oscillospiraceae bacterium]|nr:phosphodiester glycosidase family protein [Oscillospiraceae bacterium]
GCQGAFNLDGGASSQMYFNGKLVNRPTTGTSGGVVRMLPDVFYIGEK